MAESADAKSAYSNPEACHIDAETDQHARQCIEVRLCWLKPPEDRSAPNCVSTRVVFGVSPPKDRQPARKSGRWRCEEIILAHAFGWLVRDLRNIGQVQGERPAFVATCAVAIRKSVENVE